jgi:hypothetical protein
MSLAEMFGMYHSSPLIPADRLTVKKGTITNQAGKTRGMKNLFACLHFFISQGFPANPASLLLFPFQQIGTVGGSEPGERENIFPPINQQGNPAIFD